MNLRGNTLYLVCARKRNSLDTESITCWQGFDTDGTIKQPHLMNI